MYYRIARWIIAGVSATLCRFKMIGREKLPTTGFVLAVSHRSMMDIPLSAWVTARPLRYMGKASLFDVPVLGWFFRSLGGFPVQRDGTDRKALRESIAMLQNDEILLVYPEGTRQNGPKIQPLQPGAAYLALRAGVPIVPVGMAGTEEIMRTRKSHIPRFVPVVAVIGDPIVMPELTKGVVPRDQVDAVTAQLRETLQTLFDEAYAIRDGRS